MKKILPTTIVLVAILAVSGGYYLWGNEHQQPSTTYTVTLTDDGFYPSILKIKRNDCVTFVTERPNPFWPASNNHPAHTQYSAFDPKRELAPEEQWSFCFDTDGQWGYHDHLYSFFKGVIVVE